MTHRAFSFLEIKAVNEEKRIIRGVATTPTVDRVGDIVEPLGVSFKNPLPLLWQHDSRQPIGKVKFDRPTKEGITFEAEIPIISDEGNLKERIEEAWQSIKIGLVRAVSIGFRALEYAFMDEGGIRFIKTEVYELSAVTIPANADAVITGFGKNMDAAAIAALKKFDTGAPAAFGRLARPSNLTPPASGKSFHPIRIRPKEGHSTMKNVGAQIAALEEQRKEKAARLEAIQSKALGEGRSKDEAERKEFDEVRDELKALDAEIADLKDIEALYTPTGTVVEKRGAAEPSPQRRTAPAEAKKKLPPGIAFARMAKIKAVSRLDIVPELQVAEKMYGRDSDAYYVIKTGEVAPGTTTSGNWGVDLIPLESGPVADFAEYLNERTILGRFGQNGIPALRRVSFRSPLVIQTEDGDGFWVGEAKPKPVTAFDFDRNQLLPLKCANIAVLSKENIRDSSPASDAIVRDSLVSALVKVQDLAFIDPANNGSASVKPIAITYQAPAIASSGDEYADVDLDIRSIVQKFITANNALSSGVWVMSEGNAMALGMLRNELGQAVFPGINMSGGTLMGLPVITSAHVGTNVVLLNAQDVHYGDDGEVTVDMSTEASLEMKAPGSNLTQNPLAPGTGASLVSLWQNNLVGFLAEKTVNWRRRRAVSVAYLTGVTWGGAVNAS